MENKTTLLQNLISIGTVEQKSSYFECYIDINYDPTDSKKVFEMPNLGTIYIRLYHENDDPETASFRENALNISAQCSYGSKILKLDYLKIKMNEHDTDNTNPIMIIQVPKNNKVITKFLKIKFRLKTERSTIDSIEKLFILRIKYNKILNKLICKIDKYTESIFCKSVTMETEFIFNRMKEFLYNAKESAGEFLITQTVCKGILTLGKKIFNEDKKKDKTCQKS